MKLAGQPASAKATAAKGEHGYAMAALLVGLSVMTVLMSMALPVWSHMVKREKEEELIWRGNQYVRAIGLFQRKFANTFPPSVDVLVEQRFLRKKYKDPITNDDFVLLPAGAGMMPGQPPGQTPGGPPQSGFGPRPPATPGGGTIQVQTPGQTLNLGIGGVASKSKDTSIRIYNGRQKYNEWAFIAIQMTQRVGGPPGSQFPGMQMQPGVGGRMPPGGPMQPPMSPGMRGGRPPVPGQPPFGQPPFGQPPFGQPPSQPFAPPGQGQRPLPRPPGS